MPTHPKSERAPPSELWLAHDVVDPARLKMFHPEVSRVELMFLADDYARLRALRSALDERFVYCPTGRTLQESAWRLRKPFLDMIGMLGRKYDGLAWWTSRISERNVMASPLFLHVCYLSIGLEAIRGSSSSALRDSCEHTPRPSGTDINALCIVSRSYAVLRSLVWMAESKRIPVSWIFPAPSRLGCTISAYLRMAGDAVRFVKRRTIASRVARRWARACDAASPAPNRPIVLLRTFVDEGCLRSDGSFVDRHLPGLCEWLESKGQEVWTAPVIHNVKRSYLDAWRWLYQSPRKFLNPDEYYRVADILNTILHALKQVTVPRGRIVFRADDEEVDLTELVKEERLRIAFDHDALRWMLIARLPLRLRRSGVAVDRLIQGYENMIPEKGVILGFRRHMPRTTIIGFQHPIPSPMSLCHFVPGSEADVAPLPERIVCNGRLLREALVREGLPPKKIVEGPALRYAHLHAPGQYAARGTERGTCVLVALPLELSAAAELFEKSVMALAEDRDMCVRIKVHPMMEAAKLLEATSVHSLPSHMKFVIESMETLLKEARVVVSQGSGVAIEAALAGIPTVAVGRESALNLNPLDWAALEDSNGCDDAYYGIQEIRAEIRRLWSLSDDERNVYGCRAERLLKAWFNPVTDVRMAVFLTNALSGERQPMDTEVGEAVARRS